jgi:hypothetical protein
LGIAVAFQQSALLPARRRRHRLPWYVVPCQNSTDPNSLNGGGDGKRKKKKKKSMIARSLPARFTAAAPNQMEGRQKSVAEAVVTELQNSTKFGTPKFSCNILNAAMSCMVISGILKRINFRFFSVVTLRTTISPWLPSSRGSFSLVGAPA